MKRAIELHPMYKADYYAGYEFAEREIERIGFDIAHKDFNKRYPTNVKPVNLNAYFRAEGELDALVAALRHKSDGQLGNWLRDVQ